jgi:hypothetical protein
MRVELVDVTKGEGHTALAPTTLSYESGAVTLIAAETAQRPTLLALIAGGRMEPDSGTVRLMTHDAVETGDDEELRASIAIVDAPEISAPADGLLFGGIVQEELMFASLPSSSAAARAVLDELDAGEYLRWPIENVPVAVRLHVLAELASRRPDVLGLVITSPDRHGGDPLQWYPIVEGFAARGFAVLVIAGAASIALLDAVLVEEGASEEEVPEAGIAEQTPPAPKHLAPEPEPESEPESEALAETQPEAAFELLWAAPATPTSPEIPTPDSAAWAEEDAK